MDNVLIFASHSWLIRYNRFIHFNERMTINQSITN